MMLGSIARRKRNDEIAGYLTVFGRLEAPERGVESESVSPPPRQSVSSTVK
jgi:hypothetical protein